MPDTLRAKDYRLILFCLLICAASLYVGVRYFYRAFPEASIQFKVNRDSSEPLAHSFLTAQGISVDGYRHASAFLYDDDAKVFLERELGLHKANAVMGTDVRLWRWGHRWFRPLEKEEIRVEVTTRGEIASFMHALAEDAPGADLPEDAARALAESFLVLDAGRPIDSLEFLDSQIQKRTFRTDHVFTWKVRGAEYNGASYRVAVTVQGDRIDGYHESLKIPEDWNRGYARLRSLNESTGQVDLVFFALLAVGMLVTLGRCVRLRDVHWSTALTFGAIGFVLQFLASMNDFPLAEYGFDTTDSYAGFLGLSIFSAALQALSYGGIIALLTACVEPLYRQSYPCHLSISRMIGWRALRTRSFFRASLAGITLTFFFFAYEIGFYLAANRLGAWAPAEVPYTNLLNTHFPWVFVLLGGFFPAVSEEWMFRAFSIPFLQRLFRWRWLAVVLAAFIWSFGHANYPNQPFYIRGIEVGIVGLILSWAMLRFGILAPLIAHYSIDAFYSAFLLLRSGNAYLTAAGALTAGISLIPLALAVVAYFCTGRFLPDSELVNAHERSSPPPDLIPDAPAGRVLAYVPLHRKAIWIAAAILAAGMLLLMFQAPQFGESIEFRLSSSQAAQSARRFLQEQHADVAGYREAIQPRSRVDPAAVQYIYAAAGIEGLNRIYGRESFPLVWQTRFYQPLRKEEFRVDVDPSEGRIVAFEHRLPEDAPGAELSQQDAQMAAAAFLASRQYDLSGFELQESRSEKLANRRDTTLVWQARPGSPGAVAEARLRVQTGIFGSTVGLWTDFIKVPEEWKRLRDRQNLYAIGAIVIRSIFFVALFSAAMFSLVRGTRQGTIRWGLAAKIAAAAMLLELLNLINSSPIFLSLYDTQVPPQIFLLSGLVEAALLLIGIGLASALAAAIIMSCYPDTPAVLNRSCRRLWGRDALIASGATLGAFLILRWLAGYLQYRASRFALAPSLAVPASLGTYIPIISGLRDILLSALLFSAVLAFGASLWTRIQSRLWLRLLLLAGLLGSFLPFTARLWTEVALEAASAAVLVLFAATIVAAFLRDNYAAYFLSTAVLSAAHASISFLGQGNAGLEFQGWLLWFWLLGGALLFLLRGSRQ
jgi:membrane protease YdiL (CAAX protease family)